jgi:hypothetical protein
MKEKKTVLVSEARQEIEFFISETLKEKGLKRRELFEHLDSCPCCFSVFVQCPFCSSRIPFSWSCPECKKVLPLESLISSLALKVSDAIERRG